MGQFVSTDTPIPVTDAEYKSLDIAQDGRVILSQYCIRQLNKARDEKNLSEFLYFQSLANLLSDDHTGLMLGRLFHDLPLFLDTIGEATTLEIPAQPLGPTFSHIRNVPKNISFV